MSEDQKTPNPDLPPRRRGRPPKYRPTEPALLAPRGAEKSSAPQPTPPRFPEALTLHDVEAELSQLTPTSISPETREYVDTLREVSLMIQGGRSQSEIVNHLVLTRNISRAKAVAVYSETFNYYYINESLHPTAVRSYYADMYERTLMVIMRSSPDHDTLVKMAPMWEQIARLRGAYDPPPEQRDVHMMPHTVIYSADASEFGFASLTDRVERIISTLPATAQEKDAIRRQAGILQDGQPLIPLSDE